MIDRLIRPAQEIDLAAIVAIYNDVMQTSLTIWREELTSVAERHEWLAESSTKGYPVLVATDASGMLGFIAAEPFRPWPGYAATWEHSVHVRKDTRSRGVGGRLLDAMQATLRTRDAHIMVAGIDSENQGSLRFHARAGFLETGRMPEVGQMRGLWRNLVLLQKTLTPLAADAPNEHSRILLRP
jgi:L-amino acid N-acyltransferase YncA